MKKMNRNITNTLRDGFFKISKYFENRCAGQILSIFSKLVFGHLRVAF